MSEAVITADLDAGPVPIPKASQGFTPAWLTRALAAPVVAVEAQRIGEGVGVLSELHRLTLAYGAGPPGPASLIAKLHASAPEVREICALYGVYEREVRFYRDVAATVELRTPEVYFSAFDPASGDCVILLEDLAPAASPDQVAGISLGELTEAIDGIASLHARWWAHPRLDELRAIMPRAAEPPYADVAENFRACLPSALEALGARGHHGLVRVSRRLAGAIEGLLSAISTPPLTLCHGDFRTDNLMFREHPDGRELTVIDWQVVMQARGPFDLGYLMGGAVPTDLRRKNEDELLRRYHGRLVGLGVAGYGFDECRLDYRRSVLFSLVYWVEGLALADPSSSRAAALFGCWADRLAAAVDDLHLESLVSP